MPTIATAQHQQVTQASLTLTQRQQDTCLSTIPSQPIGPHPINPRQDTNRTLSLFLDTLSYPKTPKSFRVPSRTHVQILHLSRSRLTPPLRPPRPSLILRLCQLIPCTEARPITNSLPFNALWPLLATSRTSLPMPSLRSQEHTTWERSFGGARGASESRLRSPGQRPA